MALPFLIVQNAASLTEYEPRPPRWWTSLLVFLACFVLLQWGWELARGTALERFIVHRATVGTATALINWLTPHVNAHAEGASIVASGGGLNVQRGCEGVEVYLLLSAALLAFPLAWRVRLGGLAGGLLLVLVMNEARLLALFYSFRSHRALFDQLHGLVTPLLMVTGVLLFYLALLRWQNTLTATP